VPEEKSSILDNSEENHVHIGHDIRSIFLSTLNFSDGVFSNKTNGILGLRRLGNPQRFGEWTYLLLQEEKPFQV
jgi:hypothetical protein